VEKRYILANYKYIRIPERVFSVLSTHSYKGIVSDRKMNMKISKPNWVSYRRTFQLQLLLNNA